MDAAQKPSSGKAAKPYVKRANRSPRACLRCKSQKIRCDGHSQPDGRCSSCVMSKETCQYVDSLGYLNYAQRRYIQDLEDRIEKLEALLEKLHPGELFPELDVKKAHSSDLAENLTRTYVDESIVPVSAFTEILPNRRVFGTFSHPMFVQNVMDAKLKESGQRFDDVMKTLNKRAQEEGVAFNSPAWRDRILTSDASYRLTFPPNDLMVSLIDLYFTYDHMYRPVLHRPTFEKMVRARMYERDQYFGALVLIVCACGARFSDDPRPRQSPEDKSSAGWAYYVQVHHLPRPMTEPVSLVRLQMYNLMLIFINGANIISLEWSLAGMGMRLALDVGAHLNSSFANLPLSERELWKRAFWGLFVADQIICVGLGRKCVILPEDIDLDLPLEVDDEFWFPAGKWMAFVQPPNKPSVVAGFNALIRVMCLMPGVGLSSRGPLFQPEDDSQIPEEVTKLDLAFGQWLESLPPHLQWNPSHTHPIHFAQSSMLHSWYYKSIIMIYRPFLAVVDNQDNSANRIFFLDICANAARSCVHVVHTFSVRVHRGGGPWLFLAALTAGVVLLLDIWAKGTEDVAIRRCIESLAFCKDSFPFARMSRDMFCELLSITGFSASPTPAPDKRASHDIVEEGPQSSWILPAGLANIAPSSDPMSIFQFPSTTEPAYLYTSDSIPSTLESEAALLRDWSHSGLGAGWDTWSTLPVDQDR